MISAMKIANAIHKDKDARKKVKDTRLEMIEIAVELGLPQDEAAKVNLQYWLDGYLMGSGCCPEYRKEDL